MSSPPSSSTSDLGTPTPNSCSSSSSSSTSPNPNLSDDREKNCCEHPPVNGKKSKSSCSSPSCVCFKAKKKCSNCSNDCCLNVEHAELNMTMVENTIKRYYEDIKEQLNKEIQKFQQKTEEQQNRIKHFEQKSEEQQNHIKNLTIKLEATENENTKIRNENQAAADKLSDEIKTLNAVISILQNKDNMAPEKDKPHGKDEVDLTKTTTTEKLHENEKLDTTSSSYAAAASKASTASASLRASMPAGPTSTPTDTQTQQTVKTNTKTNNTSDEHIRSLSIIVRGLPTSHHDTADKLRRTAERILCKKIRVIPEKGLDNAKFKLWTESRKDSQIPNQHSLLQITFKTKEEVKQILQDKHEYIDALRSANIYISPQHTKQNIMIRKNAAEDKKASHVLQAQILQLQQQVQSQQHPHTSCNRPKPTCTPGPAHQPTTTPNFTAQFQLCYTP